MASFPSITDKPYKVNPPPWLDYASAGQAEQVVMGRFQFANDYADISFQDARTFLNDLQANLSSFSMPAVDIDYSYIPSAIEDLLAKLQTYKPEAPSDNDLTVQSPAAPTDPSLDVVPSPVIPTTPTFNTQAPTVSYPTAPSTGMPADPGSPPSLAIPASVPVPSYTEPTPPTLQSITIPSAPTISAMPSFQGRTPTIDITPPEPMFVYNENPYSSVLVTAIQTKLLSDVQNGGTGLGATVEEAIYQRGRDRHLTEYQEAFTKIMDQHAGFDLPPGALVSRLDQANGAYNRAISQINYEVVVGQARLALDNTHWSIEQSIAFESLMMDYTNKLAQRTFEAAVAVVDSAVKAYEIKIAAFNAKLEQYKAEGQVYSELVRGAGLELEVYKSQLEGVRMTVDIQNQEVVLYNARLGAIQTLVSVYSERIKAQAAELESERLKLQAFGMSVDVYMKKVEARTAEFNLYQAQLAAEGLKVDVYGKEVDAFRNQVEALRAVADLERTKSDIVIAKNAQQIDQYNARVDKYKADVQAAIERVNTVIKAYSVEADIFGTQGSAMAAQQNAEVEVLRAQIQQSNNQTALDIKEAEMILQAAIQQFGINIEAIKTLANTTAQLAASALSAIHASASLGSNYGGSNSFTYSRGESVSNAMNRSSTESYDRNESV